MNAKTIMVFSWDFVRIQQTHIYMHTNTRLHIHVANDIQDSQKKKTVYNQIQW